MELLRIPLLAVLALLRPTAGDSDSDTTEVIGAVGASVTLRSHNTGENAALWRFGDKPIVAAGIQDPSQTLFYQEKFKTRFAVSEGGRALTISQLSMQDVGTYSVTIDDETSTFTLLVFRELAEPTVTCEAQNCSGGSCRLSLRCSAPGAGFGNVSYAWRVGAGRSDRGPAVLLEEGPGPGAAGPVTCTARNRVSSRNVTVTEPRELCRENSTHPPGPGALSGSWVGVGVGIGIGAAVISFVFLLFWKSKGWRKFHLSKSEPPDTAGTAEYTTVYAEVGASQQRVPNGIKAKPTGGESSSTIYSLVKRPEQVADGAAGNATVTGLELV